MDMSDDIIILDPDNKAATSITRRFLISQSGLGDDEVNVIKNKIIKLNGVVDDYRQNQFNSFCTHIISKDFPVTEKILGALASGKWLLHPRYIHDCSKNNRWLDEQDYELPNYNFAARFHRMGRVNREGAGLYKNIRVYVKLAQKSYARAFRRVMAAGGAEILLKEDIRRSTLVITDMQHYEVISQQLPPNSNIVGIDYIKDTLIHRTPLTPLDRHFLKRAARYQGTPRKPEPGSSNQGTLAHYVSNKGYTPTKLLHRIKKEPEDGTTAVESPSHQMRKSIKKIPFTAQKYRNISTYFKTEDKEKIQKIGIDKNFSANLNQSIDGDLQIIEEHSVVRRQKPNDVMPSCSKHQGTDAIEIMLEIPNKKRKDSICEIDVVDVDDVEIAPLTTKSQAIIIKDDIDLTGDPSPRGDTISNKSSFKDTPLIPIKIDSPTVIPISHQSDISIASGISTSSRPLDIHLDSPKEIHNSSVGDIHIPDKDIGSSGSPVTATDTPASPDTSLDSPEVSSKSLRDPVSPVISTIPRRVKTRPAAIPTGFSSRRKESISSKSSTLSQTPTTPMSPTQIRGSPGSSSEMSLGSTSSSPLQSPSATELSDMYSEEQVNRKRVCAEVHTRISRSESASLFSGFASPERLQHSTDIIKQRDVSGEGEMEISYSSSSLDVHPPGISTEMDVDPVGSLKQSDAAVKRPSTQKVVRKPLLPIDLSNCVDTVLPQSENRLAAVVIRKKQMNSLVLTFMHKQNRVGRTVFSDTTDLCAHNDVEENLHKSTPPREMTVKETTRYECSMDDTLKVNRRTIKEQEIIVHGIEYLYVALTPEAFPPPKILGHLLRQLVWQETRFPIIHSRALTLVYRVLDFNPPSCTETRNLYLSTLRYAGSNTQDQDAVNSWIFIKEVIISALDMDGDQDDSSSESSGGDEMIYKSMNSVRLLDLIQALLQEDLRHWDYSPESIKDLMCIRIFWGVRDRSIFDSSESLKVSPQISKLLRLWIKSSQSPPHIRELIARLVGVVIHLTWQCSATPLVPVSPLPEPLLPLAHEIVMRWREVSPGPGMSGGFEILRLVQDLTDPWQRTVVFIILFKIVTGSQNIKFTLADLLDYGKLVGQEAELNIQEKPSRSSHRTPKSKKSSSSSVHEKDHLSPHRVNRTNHKGETALMRACISNKVAEMYKLLAVPGIDINKTDHNGWTALHEAAIKGHNTCVKLLLDYKPKHAGEFLDEGGRCDIMKRSKETGMTALHDAVNSKMFETVKLLLEYGGDRLLKMKNKLNENAFDLTDSEEMRQILHSYRGKKGKFDMMTETAEPTKRSGGMQLSKLSHTSLLSNREECQAFLLLLLNNYLNTTGFRFLMIEINRGIRKSNSLEFKQRQAQSMKNNETCRKSSHELSSSKDLKDAMSEQIDDSFRYCESSTIQKSASISNQKRESIDTNCENNNNNEYDSKGPAFTVFGGKKMKNLENYDDLLMPSDKTEAESMNTIFNCYIKDLKTFKTRKEEFSNDAVDCDFFNSLNFIFQ